jgi:transcriptional regulator with XRE-family HTH domain
MSSSPSPKAPTGSVEEAPRAAALSFGQRLRRWRNEQGLTLREVSERSGISVTYLSDLERGKLVNPTLETLTALAAALEVSLNELLGVDERANREPRLPRALEEFRASPSFQAAVQELAVRSRTDAGEVEQDWLRSLSGIRVGKRIPRSASDYLFIFEAIRRVLD